MKPRDLGEGLDRLKWATSGEGWVDWPRYVGYLRESAYDGCFAAERGVGQNRQPDIKKTVDPLRTL